MAETYSLEIVNLPQIRAAFKSAPYLMAKELDTAIKKSVFLIQRQSMINTPVRTGRLRASTYSRFMPAEGVVGTNTDYDVFVHNGTRFMKARPYLKDAIEETKGETAKFFTKAVDNVLSDIGKRT